MKHNFKLAGAVVLALSTGLSQQALAGATISFGENQSLSAGFAMRGSFKSVEGGAANGARSNDFSLDSARILLSGSLNQHIKGMLNTEKDIAGQGFQVIDANVQLELAPEFTIWAGRFLSPSDRANLAGPYYSLGGDYWAGIASRYGYNGGYIGRDDGIAAVGDLLGGRLKYAIGAFEGNRAFQIAPVASQIGTRQGSDALMYAARLQYDFWDLEPGYYGTGNYLGKKDILAIGLAGRTQNNGAYSTTKTGNYSSYSADFLLEKKGVGPGALSVEAAYYDYNTGDVFLSEQGKAYSAGVGYIFNQKVGWGQFQPFVRWQKFNSDAASNSDTRKYDIGVNYIIDGYNAQVGATYSNTKVSGNSSTNALMATMQFQY